MKKFSLGFQKKNNVAKYGLKVFIDCECTKMWKTKVSINLALCQLKYQNIYKASPQSIMFKCSPSTGVAMNS